MSGKVIILGDVMVDEYLHANPVGVSDEAPVTVLDWVDTRRMLGGMLNAASSLRTFGLQVMALGIAGPDEAGQYLRDECGRLGIDARLFDDGRTTTVKTRIISRGDYLARLDTEQVQQISVEIAGRALDAVRHGLTDASVLVISDYAKGFCTPAVVSGCLLAGKASGIPTVVDAKPELLRQCAGATWIKPNRREATELARLLDLPGARSGEELAQRLGGALDCSVLLTLDADGMTLFNRADNSVRSIPAVGGKAGYSGAGDVALAALIAGIARKAAPEGIISGIEAALARADDSAGTLTLR